MSLADKASLLLIPTGYKSQKVYSIFPTDGVGDFDFSRSTIATRIAKNGLITTVAANVPRLEYPMIDGEVVGCPSLILEPARTNVFQRSEEFSNAYWNTARIETPYIADVLSPDGTLNAYTLEISSGETGGGGVYKSISVTGDNSWSVFAKKNTVDYLVLGDTGLDGSRNVVYFNLSNGTIGSEYQNATGEMQDFGNGWYRCTMKYTLTSSGNKFIYMTNIDGTTTNSVQGGDSIYIYGAQLEQGSYPTSYIKTNGEINGVTRSAETCNGAGDAATFSDSEGVLMAEVSALADDLNIEAISINANNADNRLALFKWNVSNRLQIRVNINGATLIDAGVSVSNIEDLNKISLKYKSGDYALWINGFEVYVNSLADTPIGLSNLSFDSNGSNGVPFKGKTKQLQYYNSALTDSELEELTSWDSFKVMAIAQLYNIE
jgi:hypothetical protein